jgi:hypothetical protein
MLHQKIADPMTAPASLEKQSPLQTIIAGRLFKNCRQSGTGGENKQSNGNKIRYVRLLQSEVWMWTPSLHNRVKRANPYVQKVAGLPKQESSQPDWKFLHHYRKETIISPE